MGPEWLPNYCQWAVPSVPQSRRSCETRRDNETHKAKSTSSSCHSRIPNSKSDLVPSKPVYKIKREANKQNKTKNTPLVSVFMFSQFLEQILILKELERREEAAPGPRIRSWMAYWVVMVVAERRGRPTFHHQQDELLTPGIFPSGWFSTVICSDPGHLCCRRPGWTLHWQATCTTTEFCRISTTCPNLDNVFFQKPGLSFKQSIILPAYQFPQDCEKGKEKTQNPNALSNSVSIQGWAVGTSEQDSSLQVH